LPAWAHGLDVKGEEYDNELEWLIFHGGKMCAEKMLQFWSLHKEEFI